MQGLNASPSHGRHTSTPLPMHGLSAAAGVPEGLAVHSDCMLASGASEKTEQQQVPSQPTSHLQAMKQRGTRGKADEEGKNSRGGGAVGEDVEEPKLRSACDNCSVKKIKCDGLMPCQACRKRSVNCHFSVKRPTGPKRHLSGSVGSTSTANANAVETSSTSTPFSDSRTPRTNSSSGKGRDSVTSPRSVGGKRLRGLAPPANATGDPSASASVSAWIESNAEKNGKATAGTSSTARTKTGLVPGGVGTRQSAERGGRTGRTRSATTVAATSLLVSHKNINGSSPSGGGDSGDGVALFPGANTADGVDADAWPSCPGGPGVTGLGVHETGVGSTQDLNYGPPSPANGWNGWESTVEMGGGDRTVGEIQSQKRSQVARAAGFANGRKRTSAGSGGGRDAGKGNGVTQEQESSPAMSTPVGSNKSARRADRGSGSRALGKRGPETRDGSGGARAVARKVLHVGGTVVGKGAASGGVGARRAGVNGSGGGRQSLVDMRPKNGHQRQPANKNINNSKNNQSKSNSDNAENDIAGSSVCSGKVHPHSLTPFHSTRALGEKERHLLDVFLSTVNEFLPLISEGIVDALRKDVASKSAGARNRRGLPTWSRSLDIDPERMARGALVNAALMVGALVTRDWSAAGGFAATARQCLKEIFDTPSEETASAFLCLAYYNHNTGENLRADLYLVQAHSFCLNLEEFPLNLEICIEYLSHGRLKIDLRPNFHTWDNRRYRVLHVANHVLSMLTQQGEQSLPASLKMNDPARFEGGEGALLRCVTELVGCIRVSEQDTLARLVCSSMVGLLLMLLGRREESIAVAESVVEGVSPTPGITRVMPLSWTATIITSALLFIYGRHNVYHRLYNYVAPAQRSLGYGECALPAPGSDVDEYLRHQCGHQSSFCGLVVTIARLTERGTKNFCPTTPPAQSVHPLHCRMQPPGDNDVRKSQGQSAAPPLQRVSSIGCDGSPSNGTGGMSGGLRVGVGATGGDRGHSQQTAGEALGASGEDDGDNGLARLLASPPPIMQRQGMYDSETYNGAQVRQKGLTEGGAGGAVSDLRTREAHNHFQRQAALQFAGDHSHHQALGHIQQPQPQPHAQQLLATAGGGGIPGRQAGPFPGLDQQHPHAHFSAHRGSPMLPLDDATAPHPHRGELGVNDFGHHGSTGFASRNGERSSRGVDAGGARAQPCSRADDPISPPYASQDGNQSAGKDNGHDQRERQQQHRQMTQQPHQMQERCMPQATAEHMPSQERRLRPHIPRKSSPLNASPGTMGILATNPLHAGPRDDGVQPSTPPSMVSLQTQGQHGNNATIRERTDRLMSVGPAESSFDYEGDLLGSQSLDTGDSADLMSLINGS